MKIQKRNFTLFAYDTYNKGYKFLKSGLNLNIE